MLKFHLLWFFFLLCSKRSINISAEQTSEEIINFGDELVINCSFNLNNLNIQLNSTNKISIIWSKNNTKNIIQENKSKKKFIKYELKAPFVNGTYRVDEAFESDSDIYFCDLVLIDHVNKRKIKHITDRKSMIVRVTDESKTVNLLINSTNDQFHILDVKIYNSFMILPTVDESFIKNISNQLQSVRFNWYKDFKTYTPYANNSVVLPNFSAIIKRKVSQRDAGLYSIISTGDAFRSNISFRINVLSKPILTILYFTPINSQNLKLNWTAKCEIYAYPEGEVTWSYTPCIKFTIDSITKCNYNETKILKKKEQRTLKWEKHYDNKLIKYSIINFIPPSSGIIECKGKNIIRNNKLEERSVAANILIEDIPNSLNTSTTKPLNDIYEGDQFNLTCKGLTFFYALEWYSTDNHIKVESTNDLFSDVEIIAESTELYKAIILKFKYIKISNQTTFECRGYKDSNKTIYESQLIKINVHKSYNHLYYLLIFIPIILVFISTLYYYYYRKNNKELPWMLLYDEKFEFPVDKIKYERELGSGAFGVVFEAIAEGIIPNEPETIVAVKTIKKSTLNENTLKSLESELEILLSLGKHLNLVNLLGAVTKNPLRYKLMVIVEFCKYGNMKNYLFENRNCFINQIDPATGLINKNINSQTYDNQYNPMEFTTSTLLLWAYQIARGMDYVASQKILHGDLAARNILLSDDNVVKICDFGLAKSMNYQYNYQSKGNAPLPIRWLAIETLESGLFSSLSDIWSYGIVLWEFFSLCKDPYEKISVDRFSLLEKLQSGYRMGKPKFSNNEIHKIMLDCWNEDAESRPSFTVLEEKLKKFINENISEYYVKLNEPFEKENEENKNQKNSNVLDELVLNNSDNKVKNGDATNNAKTAIRNISSSKANDSSKEYTNQKTSENPEMNIEIKSIKKHIDNKELKYHELKNNSNINKPESTEKNMQNEVDFEDHLFNSDKRCSNLNFGEIKSLNNSGKNTPVSGYLVMTSPNNVKNDDNFDFCYKETLVEDVLINLESDDEMPLEITRSYENIDFSEKKLPITGSYENIDYSLKSPIIKPKPRTINAQAKPSPADYVVMKPIPKERSLLSLTEL